MFDSLANFLMKIAVYAGVGVVAFVVFVAVLKLLRGFLWSFRVPKDLRGAYWRTFFYFRSAVRSKRRNFWVESTFPFTEITRKVYPKIRSVHTLTTPEKTALLIVAKTPSPAMTNYLSSENSCAEFARDLSLAPFGATLQLNVTDSRGRGGCCFEVFVPVDTTTSRMADLGELVL